MKNINTVELINFFHRAPVAKQNDKCDFIALNEIAVKYGYAIHPDCCTNGVIEWLNTLTANYNATFYKEWNDVLSKDRFELFIDQLRHYATTYGTCFSGEYTYIPNDCHEQVDFKNLKVILPITYDELYRKCVSVVMSGIALGKKTVEVMCTFIVEYLKENKNVDLFDINLVKNKEAQAILSVKTGSFPSDEFAMLRCIVYQYTNSALLIKNRTTIDTIKRSADAFDSLMPHCHPILSLTNENMVSLSKIFYRFKPLFLAMKSRSTANTINRIRKLARVHHVPMARGFWETIVSERKPYSEIENRISELDNFRKVRILQAINVALFSEESAKVYQIRNGKVYTRISYSPSYDRDYLSMIRQLFVNSLVESLSKKACKVRFSKEFNLAMPSSEKSFIGNFPLNSSIRFDNNAVVGIFWKNEWGCYDFDLSLLSHDGDRIAWNSRFKNGSVIYSGDMTYADPYAVETVYIRNKCPDSIVMVNEYNGNMTAKFRLFFATEEMDPENMRNRMVDQNNIRLDTMIEVNNEKQKTVGLVCDNTFYFMGLTSGNSIVSSNGSVNRSFIDTMSRRTKCCVDLKDILLKAGFIEASDGEDADIDLSNPEKDTIIKLMSNE